MPLRREIQYGAYDSVNLRLEAKAQEETDFLHGPVARHHIRGNPVQLLR